MIHVIVTFLFMIPLSAFSNDNFTPFSLCEDKPNCVNSLSAQKKANKDRFIEPLSIENMNAPMDAIMKRLKGVFDRDDSYKLVTSTDDYLHFTFTSSIFGFVDDVEARIDRANQVIHFKSKSRKGYWDMGANKSRVEDIKFKFSQATY